MRNNFVFYTSYYECVKEFPEEEQGELYKAIIEYAMEQKEPNLSGLAKGIFNVIKPTLDKSQKQYDNGVKGGRPKREQNPNQNPTETQSITQSITQIETQTKTQDISQTETQTKTQDISQTETQSITNIIRNKNKNNKQEIKQEIKEKVNQKEKATVLTDSEVISYIKSQILDPVVCQKFIDYAENRKAMGKKYAIRTKATLDLNIKKLKDRPTSEAIEILEYSIANNYQGLFEPMIVKFGAEKKVSKEEELAWSQ